MLFCLDHYKLYCCIIQSNYILLYFTMTHYLILVIVPYNIFVNGYNAIKKYIYDVMQPYNENIEVEPYIKYTADEFKKKYEEYSKEYPNEYKSLEDYINCWSNHGKDLDKNGNIVTTYNPNSLYDWFELGGRWEGYFDDENYIKMSEYNELIKKDKFKMCSFFIDEKGDLHRDRNYGWWCSFTELMDAEVYLKEVECVLERNQDNYLYVVDCHI